MTGRSLRRLTVPILLTLGMSMLVTAPAEAALANPALQQSCGLDVVLVLDRSSSIAQATGGAAKLKEAANAFLAGLNNTGSDVALVSFGNTATVNAGPTPVNTDTLAGLQGTVNGLNISYNPADPEYTNWDDALVKAKSQLSLFGPGPKPLVIVITDGSPNRWINDTSPFAVGGTGTSEPNETIAVAEAVVQADLIKTPPGARIFALGVGSLDSDSRDNLKAISGTVEFAGATDFVDADWGQVTNYTALQTKLTEIATELCDESIIVHRLVNSQPANGFTFSATVGATTTTAPPTTANGVANFSWEQTPAGVTATITETPRAGFPIDSVSCKRNGVTIPVTLNGNSITVTVGPQDTVDCKFESFIVIDTAGDGPGGGGPGGGGPLVGGVNDGRDSCGIGIGTRSGYWMVGSDGAVYAFGQAAHLGNATPFLGSAKAVDIEPTPSGNGYWILDSAGHIYSFGDAVHLGNAPTSGLAAGETVTSLSATPTGNGYWIFTTRGRVLTIGDAANFGDMSAVPLNGPVFDSIPTPSGKGYYMVASDGGIFAFGDAVFYGSMGGKPLNQPVQSLVPDPDCKGYWLVASDGGVFAFEALFQGSMGSTKLNKPVNGMVPFGTGYLMVANDGGIFNFSNLPFFGSLGDNPPANAIVAVAALDV